MRKHDPYVCCLQETYFRLEDTHKLKVKGWKKIFHANGRKTVVAIHISDKIDFKHRLYITRDEEEPSNSTSEYLSEETPNTNLKRHASLYVHWSIIYSGQDMEAT